MKAGNKSSVGSWILAAGMALPLMLATIAQSGGTWVRPISGGAPPPGLAFEQYMVDLGKIDPRDEVQARFGFINRGAGPVVIRDFLPSCGCLKPTLAKRDYKPDESGEIHLRVRTAGEAAGPKEYQLRVKYDDPNPREAVLVFRVDLPEHQVLVRPRALIFYQLGDSATTQEVVISDPRSKGLELEGARCSTPLAKVERGGSDYDEEGTLRHRVQVTVTGTVPPGRHRGLITIKTDDPIFPELKIPLIIHGPTAPMAASGSKRQAN